jgi:hypothetical protein
MYTFLFSATTKEHYVSDGITQNVPTLNENIHFGGISYKIAAV